MVLRLLLSLDQEQERPAIKRSWLTLFEVIIDVNLAFKPRVDAVAIQGPVKTEPDTRKAAKDLIEKHIETAKQNLGVDDPSQTVDRLKTDLSNQYVFARLEGKVIQELVQVDGRAAAETAEKERVAGLTPEKEVAAQPAAKSKGKGKTAAKLADPPLTVAPDLTRFRAIFHIWPDFVIQSCIYRSQATIKADAAQRAFTAFGKGITWAVMDSGIDKDHPHFAKHKNIDPASPYHADYTGVPGAGIDTALTDQFGHGTHVAGIIAGEQSLADGTDPLNLLSVSRELDANGQLAAQKVTLEAIGGMAPKCQLVSMKVLDRFGQGSSSNLIAAIAQIQSINGHGRELHIHGVNISLGYPFEPKWFACGYSPLCVEINRLVKSGVVVVIAAGNTGYGVLSTSEGASEAAMDLTINDPGNAEYAITVGSTHRDMPHIYGVSYFSSKGPTGDGRLKPDLIAPGEKIVSCAAKGSKLAAKEAGAKPDDPPEQTCRYLETSGTSMAAPHVSGAIAAFLSIRREFIGDPERVKSIFTSTATDLGRDRNFQGAGLIDLMRAIQSV
ncbi:MAG: S8 family peptidase [Rhodospirillales bacterium]|nr:S8 family peptidase [Acetobacter sp.]